MKDLFEIATGKRFRKNRLFESINGPAVERFRMMNGSKAERSLPLALITVMPEVTYKILETGLCGQKVADSNLVDLTTFLAWLIPENACNADSNFAASNKISLARMHAKADEVYPRSATVNAAIARHKTNQGMFVRVAGDDALLMQWTVERWNVLNFVLGIPNIQTIYSNAFEITKYGFALDRSITYGVDYFSNLYSTLRHNPDMMN